MGRGKRAGTRRRRFTALGLDGDEGVADVVRLARAGHAGHAARASLQARVSAAPAVLQAMKQADDSAELFVPGVPPETSAAEVARAVQVVLAARYPAGTAGGRGGRAGPAMREVSPVLRCEVRPGRRRGAAWVAYVLLRSEELARHAVMVGRVRLRGGGKVKLLASNRSLAGHGASWRTRLEPGAERFPVGLLQVGEMAEEGFVYYWASSPFFDLSLDSHVEISPVSRVIAVTLGRKQAVYAGDAGSGVFSTCEAMLRVEIPLHSVCSAAAAQHERPGDTRRAVYLRILHPPAIFRGEAGGARTLFSTEALWDCERGTQTEVAWTRTVDPTPTKAFARASGVRVFLDAGEPFYQFFESLQRFCLSEVSRPVPDVVASRREAAVPPMQGVFREVRERFGVSFAVRYEVACLVSLGALMPLYLNGAEFWSTLASLPEGDALRTLDAMHMLAEGEDSYTLLEPMEALHRCMATLHLDASGDGGGGSGVKVEEDALGSGGVLRGFGYDSDSDADSDDIDDALIEVFKRQLNLGVEEDNTGRETFATPGKTKDGISDAAPASPGVPTPPSGKKREGDKYRTPVSRSKAESHHAYIRRLMLTPTRTVACRAESDLLNRVLREFQTHKDRFLRVSFADEDGGSIAFVASNDIYTRVRQLLRDGVEVAGERFVFLAFSSSQLRDHGCWLYNEAPPKPGRNMKGARPPTADEIRAWMGDFSLIRVPSKYAARMGQTFSSTVGTVMLENVHFTQEDDLYDASMAYCFSDGVGIMSSALAEYVTRKLRLRLPKTPSAFQVRFGGAKGMLSVWDEQLPAGKEVVLRQSMVKFASTHKTLEIVGQIILLLRGLGVPDEAFETLQRQLLRSLDASMRADGAKAALNLLYTSGCGSSDNRLKSLSPMMDAAKLFRAGLTCTNCEHLYDIMLAFRKRMLGDLMTRARIPVDVNKGMCGVGVLDETGGLEADEIFLQYTDPMTSEVYVVEGPVVVGRSPCLHPGDMQPLKAVYRLDLTHLVDVVVFPNHGVRPIPSMLSGGDLDGDLFAVIWDPLLLPTRPGYSAMNYRAPATEPLDRDVIISDIQMFFVSYLKNDRLGQIANAHIVHADKQPLGIFSEQCLKLAALHSTAVDFAKTGIPADIPRELMLKNEAGQYPDFMGKNEKVSYVSESVLGKLYRSCAGASSGVAGIRSFENIGSSKQIDNIIFSIQYDNEDMDVEARSLLGNWNSEIERLMDTFGVDDEGALVSGQVKTFHAHHSQLRGRREHFALLMRLNRQTRELRSEYRDIFFKSLNERPGSKMTVLTVQKACSWYKAAKVQSMADKAAGRPAFHSFPWVVSDVLGPIISAQLRPGDNGKS